MRCRGDHPVHAFISSYRSSGSRDGDFRRWAEKEDRVLELKMRDVMTKNPISVAKDTLIVSVLKLIKERKVDDLVVIDAGNVVQGFIDSQDLPGFKMM